VDEHLGRVVQILDLGANVGLFGAFAATRWPGSEILAFEPDPTNAVLHHRVIEMNGLQARWRLRRAAAGTEAGEASFVAGEIALSHLAGAGEVAGAIEVSVEDVMPHLAGADLLKMDIEGGEWAILSDPRFRESPPRALVLEYHPRSCPAPEPRGTAESLLRGAGLSVQSIWHRDDGHGMLWAWRS
jgi:FkbM family methyltransferase